MKVCPSCGLRYPNDATNCFVDRTALQDAPDPWIGTLIAGRYRIESMLGEGGMATVYKARSALQDRPVAIKLFRKELARDPKLRERFRREATSTKRLAHPNIIEILDSGDTDDGTPFLVMEFLQGESLESLMEKGRMPLWRAIDLVLQTLNALARAHDFQVLHRDLKPDNLYVCRGNDGFDVMKILDFGIARSMHDPRLTGAGEVFGTPQYMAPERITSIDAGPAADIYSMGVILYELATGRLPFEADDITGYLLKHLRETPPRPRAVNPEIPPALDNLILKMLEKDPGKRPVDAHAIVKELGAVAQMFPKPKPAHVPRPAIDEAPPTSPDGVKRPIRSTTGTLSSVSVERWEKRLGIFNQMLSRAFPPGRALPPLVQGLERVRGNIARLRDVRNRSLAEQKRMEDIGKRARDAQARFGHAMETLAKELSRIREEVRQAKEYEQQYAERVKHGAAPFASLHARIAAQRPVPSPDLAVLYRQALEAMELTMNAPSEHARAVAYLQRREQDIRDTEFQIQELRGGLARMSQTSEDEQAAIQRVLDQVGSELSAVEQTLINDATELANALRGRAELRDLFAELEADAA